MSKQELNVFVPNGESRADTAALLVGTADEFGISQREIRTAENGFYISDRLADFAFGEDEAEPETVAETPTKTSGNRAAKTKKSNSKEE